MEHEDYISRCEKAAKHTEGYSLLPKVARSDTVVYHNGEPFFPMAIKLHYDKVGMPHYSAELKGIRGNWMITVPLAEVAGERSTEK